jgi:hypothetical protein
MQSIRPQLEVTCSRTPWQAGRLKKRDPAAAADSFHILGHTHRGQRERERERERERGILSFTWRKLIYVAA